MWHTAPNTSGFRQQLFYSLQILGWGLPLQAWPTVTRMASFYWPAGCGPSKEAGPARLLSFCMWSVQGGWTSLCRLRVALVVVAKPM